MQEVTGQTHEGRSRIQARCFDSGVARLARMPTWARK